jgi:hypothetical protein
MFSKEIKLSELKEELEKEVQTLRREDREQFQIFINFCRLNEHKFVNVSKKSCFYPFALSCSIIGLSVRLKNMEKISLFLGAVGVQIFLYSIFQLVSTSLEEKLLCLVEQYGE